MEGNCKTLFFIWSIIRYIQVLFLLKFFHLSFLMTSLNKILRVAFIGACSGERLCALGSIFLVGVWRLGQRKRGHVKYFGIWTCITGMELVLNLANMLCTTYAIRKSMTDLPTRNTSHIFLTITKLHISLIIIKSTYNFFFEIMALDFYIFVFVCCRLIIK